MTSAAANTETKPGQLSPEDIAKDAMTNFARAIFGENLRVAFTTCQPGEIVPGQREGLVTSSVSVRARFSAWGRMMRLEAEVPIEKELLWMCSEQFFPVKTSEGDFTVYSEAGRCYDSDKLIALQAFPHMLRGYIYDGFESEVLFRCAYDELPFWARDMMTRDPLALALVKQFLSRTPGQ